MTRKPNPITIDLNRLPAAIVDSARSVLERAGVLDAIRVALGEPGAAAMLRELGNNVAHTVAVDCDIENPPDIERCTMCDKPAHPSETTDDGVCEACIEFLGTRS